MPVRHVFIAAVVLFADKMGLLQHVAILASLVSTIKSSPAIHLPEYGTFVGTSINQTLTNKALPAPVDAWLGIDYASQPTGSTLR